MKKHHTKNKGDYGLLRVMTDLHNQGYVSFTSISEHQDFDLIAYKTGGVFKRIQVKYRSIKNGSIIINFRSCYSDKNGVHNQDVDKNEIDLYAVYVPEIDRCFYFNPKDFNKSVTLRVTKPLNNQDKNINYIGDYSLVK